MAGLLFVAATQAEFTTGTAEMCPLCIYPPDANTRLKVKRWSVAFDGIDPTAAPIPVTLARTTSAGSFTNSLTPVLWNNGSEASRATAKSASTAIPTKGAILDVMQVHPQTGYEVILPLGDEIIVPGSGSSAGIAIYLTAPAAVNVLAKIWYEE